MARVRNLGKLRLGDGAFPLVSSSKKSFQSRQTRALAYSHSLKLTRSHR